MFKLCHWDLPESVHYTLPSPAWTLKYNFLLHGLKKINWSTLTCLMLVESSETLGSDSEAKPSTTGTAAASAEDQTAISNSAVDSSSFDRLLEAASSGGMSDDLKLENGDDLQNQDQPGTVQSNPSSQEELAGKAALAKALARHNITVQTKAAAVGKAF